jgi:hypothetical protein
MFYGTCVDYLTYYDYHYGIDIIIEYIRYRNVIIIALAMTYK